MRATGGRGGGTTRQNEGRRRQGRPQRPPAEGASQGTGRPLRQRPGTRGKPAGITLHRSPEQSHHTCGAEPTRSRRNPREPEKTPSRERTAADTGASRRRPSSGSGSRRPTTRRTRPNRRSPKRVGPRERGLPRETRTLRDPEEGRRAPANPPAVGTLPWKGGRGDNRTSPRAHSTHHARHARAPGEAETWTRPGAGRTRRKARGRTGGGWDREPTAALLASPTSRGNPRVSGGVPRTRACARPFPTTCHQGQLPRQDTAQRRVDKLCPA